MNKQLICCDLAVNLYKGKVSTCFTKVHSKAKACVLAVDG